MRAATRNAQRGLLTAEPVVEVFGEPVALPNRAEWEWNCHRSLDQIMVLSTEEHEVGCCDQPCDGRCAEQSYARWSAGGWS